MKLLPLPLLIVIGIVLFFFGYFVFLAPQDEPASNGTSLAGNERYIDYSKTAFREADDKRRILFFHAVWCPTCRVAHDDIVANLNKIPDDVVIFKTDYDTEKTLKKQYAVTYQHTFVLIDQEGKEVSKWNGGDLDKVLMFLEK